MCLENHIFWQKTKVYQSINFLDDSNRQFYQSINFNVVHPNTVYQSINVTLLCSKLWFMD